MQKHPKHKQIAKEIGRTKEKEGYDVKKEHKIRTPPQPKQSYHYLGIKTSKHLTEPRKETKFTQVLKLYNVHTPPRQVPSKK
jgi:hypothetical protein